MSDSPVQAERSVRGVIARNTIFNALGRFWEAGLTLLLTWYIVHRLGTEGWGLWSLVAVFAGYAALLDFGVGSGFGKFIAQHWAHQDIKRVSSVVLTGLCFYALLGLLLLLIGWPAIRLGLDFFVAPRLGAGPEAMARLAELRHLFHGALVLFIANNCLAPFAAVPTGLQRMGVANLLSVLASILKVVATVFFLEAGYGVIGLLYANAVVTLFLALAGIAIAFWLAPGLTLHPRVIEGKIFQELFSFGWRTQIAKFSNLINFQTDRVIIAWLYGSLGLVGLYRLGEELAGKMRQAPGLLVTALTPAASDLDARDQEETLRRMYLISTKYMASVSIPLVLYVIAAADILMHAWMGNRAGLDQAAWVMRILALGYLLNLIPGPGVSIVLGKGRADIPMIAGLISTFSNILLTLLLGLSLGFYGIPIATALSMGLSTLWFFYMMASIMDVSFGMILRKSLLWPFLAALPGAVFVWGAVQYLSAYPGHLPNLIAVALSAAAFATLYVLCIGLSPFLDQFDLHFLRDTLGLEKAPGFQLLARRVLRHD